MQTVLGFLFLILFLFGVYLLVISFLRSRRLFWDSGGIGEYIINSASWAASASLLFWSFIYLWRVFEEPYRPIGLVETLSGFGFILLLIGIPIFLGVLYTYFIMGKYSGFLVKKGWLRKKDDKSER
jgi:hypothetical protein